MLRARVATAAGRLGRLLDRLARAARSERGRWAGRVAVLAVAAAVLVVVLYGHGELPRAAARPAPAAGRASGGRVGERPPARPRPAPSTPPAAARPAEVGVAWYAGVHHLPPGSVRALQQDRRSATEVRVLVLAKGAGGRLDTALVRVRRGPRGWAVPSGAPAQRPGRAARPLRAGGGPR
jgi:hypothetical protein